MYARVYRAQLMFQFTHPGRGATYLTKKDEFGRRVSIHAPREGCDQAGNAAINAYMQFQFTHPGRGAPIVTRLVFFSPLGFNSRTPGGVRRLRTAKQSSQG